jgi:hypothetical protein
MKKLLSVLLVAGLLVGCGDEQQQAVNDPSIPAAIPCMACSKPVSKKTDKCPQCGHPTPDSVVAYKKAQELARIRAEEEERRLAEIRAEEERKAKPFGGLEVLAKIKEAKEIGATKLSLHSNEISDVSPLAGLTKLEYLHLGSNQITDLSPLAGLTNLKELRLNGNQISDLSPLKGLTNLEYLDLYENQISDLSPLARLTKLEELHLGFNPIPEDQKAMIKKALPDCDITF